MSPIKGLQLAYEDLSNDKTFTSGDTVVGMLSFTLKENTKLKKVVVKLKGQAYVHWSEGSGQWRRSYTEMRDYFNVKKYFVEDNGEGTELSKGDHRYPFELKFPEEDFPSSFDWIYGNITYKIEAKISRSRRLSKTKEKEISFASNTLHNYGQSMRVNSGTVDTDAGVFTKGRVRLTASVDRTICHPGDVVSVFGTACNFSSKEMKVKFRLQKNIEYRAENHVKKSVQILLKLSGNTLKENAEETFSTQIKIPEDATATVHNCGIITAQYYIRVFLDISMTNKPDVEIPLIIMPLRFASHQSGGVAGPTPGGFAGAPSYSDFPAPGYPQPYPGQQATSSAYGSHWPQQAPQYGLKNNSN